MHTMNYITAKRSFIPVCLLIALFSILPGGGGYSLIRAQWGRAASQGMFFGIFVLNRVSNLSFFVFIRVSIYQFLS